MGTRGSLAAYGTTLRLRMASGLAWIGRKTRSSARLQDTTIDVAEAFLE
jgi:hypothetical protein